MRTPDIKIFVELPYTRNTGHFIQSVNIAIKASEFDKYFLPSVYIYEYILTSLCFFLK